MGAASGSASGMGLGALASLALMPFTGGFSAAGLALGAGIGGGIGGAVGGHQDTKKAEGRANAEKDLQVKNVMSLQKDILNQPVTVKQNPVDNQRKKMLQSMRLGIASTLTGASGAASPSLKAPALGSGSPMKTVLGG